MDDWIDEAAKKYICHYVGGMPVVSVAAAANLAREVLDYERTRLVERMEAMLCVVEAAREVLVARMEQDFVPRIRLSNALRAFDSLPAYTVPRPEWLKFCTDCAHDARDSQLYEPCKSCGWIKGTGLRDKYKPKEPTK